LKKKVVLNLITGLNTGGAELMLYKTVKHLDKAQYRSIVVSMLPAGGVSDLLLEQGSEVYSLNLRPRFPNPFALFKLISLLRRERPVILQTYMFHADLLGRIAGKIAGVPIIISSIRNENIGGKWRERILGITDFMVDKVAAVCKSAGLTQVNRGTTKSAKLQVIYNGIELHQFHCPEGTGRGRIRQEFGIPDNHFLFIHVGRQVPQKNQLCLISSFGDLLLRNPNCTLLMIGDGPLEGSLREKAQKLGIIDRVLFAGMRRDVPQLLHACDAFVLSSLWEGFPNAVIEAMAASVPVIATRAGGTMEVVEEGVSGFLISPGNRRDLTEVMFRMISLPPDVRKEMGRKGRQIVEQRFTIQCTIEATQRMYEGLLTEKGKWA
jgi:glycosyltransferase involved in cell wall biosynthesis